MPLIALGDVHRVAVVAAALQSARTPRPMRLRFCPWIRPLSVLLYGSTAIVYGGHQSRVSSVVEFSEVLQVGRGYETRT